MKKTIFYSICIAGGLSLASCNDFLDLEPITNVATTEYLYAENDLAAYAANLYAFDLGYDEYFDSDALCLVEWPEKIEPLLPDDTLNVRIDVTGPTSRTVTIG